VLLGLLKIILLWWIILTVVKWYRRIAPGGERRTVADRHPSSESHAECPGNIVDAEFEEIDDTKNTSS
jgi:hypothetical protein